jgi:hypothetical protein
MPLATPLRAAFLTALPLLAACKAAEAPSPEAPPDPLPFACLARWVEEPFLDPAETARFNALAAPGADAALMASLAGYWSFRSPPPDPAVMDAAGSAEMVLAREGSLIFTTRFCTPSGCGGGTEWGRWRALAEGSTVRVLLQRNAPDAAPAGYCSELSYDPSRPSELLDLRAEATWTRG